ncbi:uncharacterized protein LOC141914519 [Tubulanus polymorphus]|uniref:uncharacterized protein LOC141914519 n=1 Tax=Tubulanus polymorphus TaxID=672921 RepID=UPI003DA663FA
MKYRHYFAVVLVIIAVLTGTCSGAVGNCWNGQGSKAVKAPCLPIANGGCAKTEPGDAKSCQPALICNGSTTITAGQQTTFCCYTDYCNAAGSTTTFSWASAFGFLVILTVQKLMS